MAQNDKRPVSDEELFPELFYHTEIDPRTRKRTVEMEVLVMGMPRTGTMSMKTALDILGVKNSYHMKNLWMNPPDAVLWQQAVDAKYKGKGKPLSREQWDQLLSDNQAVIDAPGVAFLPELIAAYPSAKVIISERPADKWIVSYLSTVGRVMERSWLVRLLTRYDPVFYSRIYPIVGAIVQGLLGPHGPGHTESIKARYTQAHEELRRLVPADRRLEFSLADGWGPLCGYLGKEVPDVEFPHVNDTSEFLRRMKLMMRLAVFRVLKRMVRLAAPWMVAIGAIGAAAWFRLGR